MQIPKIKSYQLKKEYFSEISQLINEMMLTIFLSDEHFLTIISKTSTPYIQFEYNVSDTNPINDYLCHSISHSDFGENATLFNLEPNKYFGKEKFKQIVDGTVKCIIHPYTDQHIIDKNLDKFEVILDSNDWSAIVTDLEDKGIIKTKMSERRDYRDGRKIININSQATPYSINVDDLGTNSEYGQVLANMYATL